VRMVISMLLLLALAAVIALLQIFLANRKNKWFCALLPCLFFLISFMPVMQALGLENPFSPTTFYNGIEPLSLIEAWKQAPEGAYRETLRFMIDDTIKYFFLLNIPTVLCLVVNVICRRKQPKNSPLQKMSVQDLE